MRLKVRRSKVKVTDAYVFAFVPFGTLLSWVSHLTLQEKVMRYKRKEICKLDRGQRSAVSCGEKTVGSHLVSILSSHTWGSRWTRKPHRTLHPITASGTNRALLTLQGTREGCSLTLKHLHKTPGYPSPLSSQLTAPCPMLTGTPFSPAAPGGPCGPGRPGGPMGPPDPAAPRSPGEP